jgi:hypothetical protein
MASCLAQAQLTDEERKFIGPYLPISEDGLTPSGCSGSPTSAITSAITFDVLIPLGLLISTVPGLG